MARLRCPTCHAICGDDPQVEPTLKDGTAYDSIPCFECELEELEGYPDDAA